MNKACTACSTVSCPRHDELAVVLVTEQQDRSYTTTSCSRICTVGRQHVLFHRSTPSSRNNSLHCDRSIDPSHRKSRREIRTRDLATNSPVRVVVCIGCWLLPPSFWYASRAAMSDRRTKKTGITVELAKSFHGSGILTFIYLSASRAPWFGWRQVFLPFFFLPLREGSVMHGASYA